MGGDKLIGFPTDGLQGTFTGELVGNELTLNGGHILTGPGGSLTIDGGKLSHLSDGDGNPYTFGNIDYTVDFDDDASYTDHSGTFYFYPIHFVYSANTSDITDPANDYKIVLWGNNWQNHLYPDGLTRSFDGMPLGIDLVATGTPVPEPSTILLFGLAGAGLLLYHRRRKQSS